MFDDPKKELQDLEDQLLAAEIDPETADLDDAEFEELYNRILEEYGPREQHGSDPVSDPPIRNFANGYGNAAPVRPQPAADEPLTVQEPAPRNGGVKGLVLLVTLEALAIAVLAGYWLMEVLG